MDKAKALELIKRVAAMLLMACFFMPLSQCSAKIYPEAQQARADFHLCGYEMAQDALRDIEAGQLNGVAIVIAAMCWISIFCAACLRLRSRKWAR